MFDQEQVPRLQPADVKPRGGVLDRGSLQRSPGRAAIGGGAFPDALVGAQQHPERAVLALHRHRFAGKSSRPGRLELSLDGKGFALVRRHMRENRGHVIGSAGVGGKQPVPVGQNSGLVEEHALDNRARFGPRGIFLLRIRRGDRPAVLVGGIGQGEKDPELSVGIDPRAGIVGLERSGPVRINGQHLLPGFAAIGTRADHAVGMRAALDDLSRGRAGKPSGPEPSALRDGEAGDSRARALGAGVVRGVAGIGNEARGCFFAPGGGSRSFVRIDPAELVGIRFRRVGGGQRSQRREQQGGDCQCGGCWVCHCGGCWVCHKCFWVCTSFNGHNIL